MNLKLKSNMTEREKSLFLTGCFLGMILGVIIVTFLIAISGILK